METAVNQGHIDRIKTLKDLLAGAKCLGRDDGLGNPIVNIDLYQKWAREAADSLEWILMSRENNLS